MKKKFFHQQLLTLKLFIMAGKPIKRNKNIVALSKDHHHGLLLCWKIRQGLKMNVELERIRKYINFFWETHMVEHFRQEEVQLFSQIHEPVCKQGIDEHEIIRLLISGINGHDKQTKKSYSQLVNLIEQHIRYEERVLFPYLETNISAEVLETIGKELEKYHPEEEVYEDEFWILKKEVVAS